MNQQSQILYITQMAAQLGRTEAAIRSAVNRGADWLPPSFRMGRLIAWRKEDVDKFLKDQAAKTRR